MSPVWPRRLGILLVLCSAARSAAAQHAGLRTLSALLDTLARDAALFDQRRDAIAAGYRRVGTDFPGMGEHWVLSAAVFAGSVDPARPSLLTYAEIAGRPRLVGAGFIVPVWGDTLPHDLPGWPAAWHEHSGLLADESGARPGEGGDRPQGVRIWVLHAWTALPNPAGENVADNWALPFARAGLAPPPQAEPIAGRAMSLVVGGDVYFRGLVGDAVPLSTGQVEQVDSAIARAVAKVHLLTDPARNTGALDPEAVDGLRVVWGSLTAELNRIVGGSIDRLLLAADTHRHR